MYQHFDPYQGQLKGGVEYSPGPASGPRFPVSPNLPREYYPDITPHVEDLKFNIWKKAGDMAHYASDEDMAGLFRDRFNPKGKWDVIDNRKPQFPGFDDFGQPQYALYKNKVIHGPFLSNHLFGHALAFSHYHPEGFDERLIPKVGQAYKQQAIPQTLRDPLAIASGFRSAHGNHDWTNWDFPIERSGHVQLASAQNPYNQPHGKYPKDWERGGTPESPKMYDVVGTAYGLQEVPGIIRTIPKIPGAIAEAGPALRSTVQGAMQEIPEWYGMARQGLQHGVEDAELAWQRYWHAKGLNANPTVGRNGRQLNDYFSQHPEFVWKGKGTPETGEGSWVIRYGEPNQRGFHVDAKGKGSYPSEPTHVDVTRTKREYNHLREQPNSPFEGEALKKRKFWTGHD